MKDSNKKSKKSSSDSVDPVKNTIPEMPKDKRTKAYKEWVKKYGDQILESNDIPEMPKDKRTKAYKEWVKQYGDQKLPSKNQDTSSKSDKDETKKVMSNKGSLSENVNLFKELINSSKRILYVNETIGRGSNLITGDYSVGASGLMIENGEFSYPVSEITIAGNLNDIFKNISLANDLEFNYATNSPTMLVEGMIVGGK